MIVLHHLNNSRSQRVLWLLEELGVPYHIERYKRLPSGLAPPELKAVHPLGKSPVLTDDTEDKTEDGGAPDRTATLAESGAIVEYLVDRYDDGRLAPPRGTPERLRFTYWLHYAEGSAMPPLLLRLVFSRLDSDAVPFFIRPLTRAIANKVDTQFIGPQIRNNLDFLEGELAKSPWFVGQAFSAADIQLSFPIEAARQRGGLDASRPRLMDWLARIHARPAYGRAIERGGAYRLMG